MRVMLNRYHGGSVGTLFNSLSQEDIQKILSQDIQTSQVQAALECPHKAFEKIHYSWLQSSLEQFPEAIQAYILSSLPESAGKSLSQQLNKPYEPIPLPETIKKFMRSMFYTKIGAEEVLPITFLPQTPALSLTTLSKSELIDLVDFLGLHDLVPEVRQMVDKQKLKRFYSSLTRGMQLYLQKILHQPDKIPVQGLGLEQWNGDKAKLLTVVHRRGLIRLAKALSGQHPDLIWHLGHILDKGRAAVLSKYYSKEEIANSTPIFIMQVNNAMIFLRKLNEKAT